MNDSRNLSARDLAVYQNAYESPDAIRAGHAWYKAWPRDINDGKTYRKLEMPVLGLGAELTGYQWLQAVGRKASNFKLVKVEKSGHFVHVEQPQFITRQLIDFFR
ncbi:MAG: alpha/beta fold hydrolase [Gammaproteobacteria bacterium]